MTHQPQSLLVTGGAGFIGANFVHYWMQHYPAQRVTVLDALTYAGNIENLAPLRESPYFNFVHGDIRDFDTLQQVLTDAAVDTIVHFAAESHVDRSIHGPDAFIDTNVLGTHTLLKAAKATWLDQGTGRGHRFHHVSTDEVYGTLGPLDPPFEETTPYAPNSPYAASKAASDHLVRAYHHTYGLNTTTSNCSNNYGPYHFPEKLIPLLIVNMLAGEPLPVYGDGLQVRDWLHVQDHCRGIDRVIHRGIAGETYNIGGNNERPNMEIVTLLCGLMDAAFQGSPALCERFPEAPPAAGRACAELITHVTDRPGHDRRYAINAEKAMRQLGYRPEITFEDGLQQTLDWYLENETWWRRVMDGSYREWVDRHYRSQSSPETTRG
jgi:dTDP-glucose 4,6-dehydratase